MRSPATVAREAQIHALLRQTPAVRPCPGGPRLGERAPCGLHRGHAACATVSYHTGRARIGLTARVARGHGPADPETGLTLAGLAQEQSQVQQTQACCKQVSPTALHPTLKLIRDRLAAGTLPGRHNDGEKLALIVEGGGMQGIISAAMCLQLSRLGLKNTFDAVYGASAGAINGAYFIAGQHEGLHCYTEYCTRTEFLDLSLALPKVLPKALQGYYVKYIKARSGTGDAAGASLASEMVAGSDNSGLSSSTSASTSIQGNGSHSSGHRHKASGDGHAQAGASDAHGSAHNGSAGDGSPAKASGSKRGGSHGSHAHGSHKKSHVSSKTQSSSPSRGNGRAVPEAVGAANGSSSSSGSSGVSSSSSNGGGSVAGSGGGSSSVAGSSSAGHGVTGNGARKGYWKSRLHDYWEDGAMPRALREYWSNRSSVLQSYWGSVSVSSVSSTASIDDSDSLSTRGVVLGSSSDVLPGTSLSNVVPYQGSTPYSGTALPEEDAGNGRPASCASGAAAETAVAGVSRYPAMRADGSTPLGAQAAMTSSGAAAAAAASGSTPAAPSAPAAGAAFAPAAAAAAAAAATPSPLAERPAMDLDYLMGQVLEYKVPLDWDAVLNSQLPLKAVASSLDTLEPILLSDFTDKADLAACLTASATVPEFAGPPRMVRGHRCVDAAVFEPVPLKSALADGCTHALVLCSRVAAAPPDADSGTRAAVTRMAKGMAKKMMETVVKRTFLSAEYMDKAWAHNNSNASYIHDELLLGALRGSPEDSLDQLGAYVLPLYPDSACGVNPICQDKDSLWAAREEGCRIVQQAIGLPLGLVDPPPEPKEPPTPREAAA